MSVNETGFPKDFILRITKDEWLKQVFTIKKYYPGIGRRWEPNSTILLARKAENKDSFIGYGVLERFIKREDLPEKEKAECEKMGWKGVLVFSELYKFEPPLPIKDTVLAGTKAKGRCFHGYPLTRNQVKSILDMAREKCDFQKID